jgi:hypothetical protein
MRWMAYCQRWDIQPFESLLRLTPDSQHPFGGEQPDYF